MGTLSKAVGCVGGFICGSLSLKKLLIHRARSLLYSTGLPSVVCRAAAAAVGVLQNDPAPRERLWKNIRLLADLLKQPVQTPIMPIIIGDERRCLEQAEKLFQAGIMVPAVRYPTVARGKARLRISLTAAQTEEDIARLADALKISTSTDGIPRF